MPTEIKELLLSTEDELVRELSKRRRYLLYEIGTVEYSDEDVRDYERYVVMEKNGRDETRVAWTDYEMARAWTDAHEVNGPYCGSWIIPELAQFREWIESSGPFVKGDVINWIEGVWDRSGPKPAKLGDLENFGKIVGESRDGKWIFIRLEESQVLEDKAKDGRVHTLQAGIEIKRARTTVARFCRRVLREGEAAERTYWA